MADETWEERRDREKREERIFSEDLMTHDWPESGPGGLNVEVLYQLFKARLMRELAAQEQIGHFAVAHYPLVNTVQFTESTPAPEARPTSSPP